MMKNQTGVKKMVLLLVVLFFLVTACSNGKEDPAETDAEHQSNDLVSVVYKVYGLNFGPFIGTQDPSLGAVVSEDQLRKRLNIIAPYTRWIRTYGSTHGLENAGRIARELGLKTAIGAWLSNDLTANQLEMEGLIKAAQAGDVDLAIVGNETLLRDDLSSDQLVGYINQFRAEAPDVPVTTADVYGELIGHPLVIEACDLLLANFYPYWEGIDISESIAALHASYQELVAVADGKEIIVSETGWPSAGDQIGKAVPTSENAAAYFLNFVSWAKAEGVDYFYFEALDEPWKSAYEGPQGANWGIFDQNGVLKTGMQDVFDEKTVENNWSCVFKPGGEGTPTLEFTSVPEIGSYESLKGRALHVWPEDYKVTVYIKVGNGYWTKPYFAWPATDIGCEGNWVCDITTGGSDASATEIVAYLIPADYDPPSANGGSLPTADLEAKAVAHIAITR